MSAGQTQKKEKVKVFAGRYAYVRPLGRGAGGSVYLAEDLHKGRRQVALKVLTPEAYGTVQGKMLRREFEILSKLDHPNLVRVYDYGRLPDGGVYLAEEYIDGFSLQDARALLSPEAMIGVTRQILEGLAYLHGMSMIHRDIKPANVMLLWLDDAPEPLVKVVDFGLSSSDPKRDTLRGGTRSYMAPEVIMGEKGEPRSDMFSLGVTLYYALCGVLPFGPRGKDDPPPTEEDFRPPEPHRLMPGVPLALSRMTMALLRQVPDVEFMDAGEALQALARDVEPAVTVRSGLANSGDVAAPHVLRGYFDRGVLAQLEADGEYLAQALVDEASGPGGLLYLIAGEAQRGKSRLLREVETACKLSGRLVVSTECRLDLPPWGLVTALLSRLLEITATRAINPLERYREPLHVLRGLQLAGFDATALVMKAQGDWLGRALQEAASMLREESLVLFVEDLHLSDRPSLDLLRAWFERDGVARADMVVTCGPTSRLKEMAGMASVRPVLADGLTREDVEQFFSARLKISGVPAEWTRKLASHAAGLPAYLEEVCRQLVDVGALRRVSASTWALDVARLDQHPLPSSLRESVRRRLQGIGATAREVLELMVLLDRPVYWETLRGLGVAGGEKAQDVDHAIEALHWRHLIEIELEPAGREVRLIHPAVGEAVSALLAPEWRRALHRRIGLKLADLWRISGGDAAEVMRHLVSGGKPEVAAPFALAAAKGALAAGHPDHARAHLEAVINRDARTPDDIQLLLEAGKLALIQLDRAGCEGLLKSAEDAAERLGLDWPTFHVALSAAEWWLVMGEPERAEQSLLKLRDLLPVMAQQPRVLELHGILAELSGDMTRAQLLCRQARDRYAHFGNTAGTIRTASCLARVAGVRGETEDAGRALQEAYDLARSYDMQHLLGEALLLHARLMRQAQEVDKALRLLSEALEVLGSPGESMVWLELVAELGEAHLSVQNYEAAALCAEEVAEVARRLEHRFWLAYGTMLRHEIALASGASASGRHLVEMDASWQLVSGRPYYIGLQTRMAWRIGRAYRRLGQQERARTYFEAVQELSTMLGAAHMFPTGQ
jgi:serine/threonine protein kinase/tetratricopeptide (TPR) repeat protein